MKSMKSMALIFVIFSGAINSYATPNSIVKYIFVPHIRSEETSPQTVNPGIAKINFAPFTMKLLGGDLLQATTKDTVGMNYVNGLFDLGNVNTLWSIGNHDLENGNRAMITTYTHRGTFYTYYKDSITFMVLDCELNANGFTSTFIADSQLQMVKKVCDTISKSRFLVILHSRYIWMANNLTDFPAKWKTDSIAASSRSMDTTNFYSDVYPLLQKVVAKGIPVIVLGGDKSMTNVKNYHKVRATDSISFYAAAMSNTYTDSANYVIVLNHNMTNQTIALEYISLANINKQSPIVISKPVAWNKEEQRIRIGQVPGSNTVFLQLSTGSSKNAQVHIYTLNGTLCQSVNIPSNANRTVRIDKPGIYVARALTGNTVQVMKFVCQ